MFLIPLYYDDHGDVCVDLRRRGPLGTGNNCGQ
jgi:hypothetical protein